MKCLASLAILLCMSSATLCAPDMNAPVSAITSTAEAKIVLSAPSVCRVGELVRLDVSESTADSFKWLLVPDSVDWLVYEEGARAVFSARKPGEYRFIIACAKEGTVDVVTHVVTCQGPPEEPMSDDLSQLIPYWNWDFDLPADEREAMAVGFEGIADRADELGDTNAWLKVTGTMSRDTLGARLDAWKPLLDKIGANLSEKAKNGALSSPEEHQNAWMDIARGLRNG